MHHGKLLFFRDKFLGHDDRIKSQLLELKERKRKSRKTHEKQESTSKPGAIPAQHTPPPKAPMSGLIDFDQRAALVGIITVSCHLSPVLKRVNKTAVIQMGERQMNDAQNWN